MKLVVLKRFMETLFWKWESFNINGLEIDASSSMIEYPPKHAPTM